MTGFLHEREFSRQSFLKGGGALIVGVSIAGAAAVVPRSFAHSAGSPSKVVIAFPETAATGVTHDRISFPSSSTEHAPHCASPQPKRGPCRCSSLCRTYSNGVSSDAVTG